MKKFFLPAALFLLLILHSPIALAAPLDSRAQQVIDKGASARALWGAYAIDLSSGDVLLDLNGKQLHVPASNRKLVATAMAAWLFKPDHRFRTELRAPEGTGAVANGDLILHATGDPSWTPALMGGRSGTAKLQELARQVKLAGIERITGDVVIDTGRFGDPAPLGAGWIWEDLSQQYGSRASVLAVNHNLVGLNLRPGSPGQAVGAEWAVPVAAMALTNTGITGSSGSAPTLTLLRDLDGRSVTLTGSLPADAGPSARAVPVGDPVRIWGELFKYYLQQEGVKVEGQLRLDSRPGRNGRIIGAVEGAAMEDILVECNEESDNFLAESLYLLASAERYGTGSYRGARQLEESFWKEMGVESGEVSPADGSGLSRENYITPHALAVLLKEYEKVEWFKDSLPVSGRSGTLRYRLSQGGMAGRVRAKTGTLTGVSGLSGYVTTNSGRTVAFSIMANHYTASSATIRKDIDAIVEILASR